MTERPSDIAFSPAVKAMQERLGSRDSYARMEWKDTVTDDLAAFIGQQNHFYIATANADGQPTIQHRGGAAGFLKVLDEKTLAFADFSGNRQYISAGNIGENGRVCLFLINYANQSRIKIWGRAKVVEDDAELIERLTDADYPAGKPERAFVITIEAWDVNCKQHITRRYTEAQIEPLIETVAAKLEARIAELEAEVQALKENGNKVNRSDSDT